MRGIRYIVLHCTATSQKARVEDIKKYWRVALGWKNVGYHIIIKPDGTFERLAADDQVTNGVKGYNSNSIHISYIGGVDAKGKAIDNRTPEQIKAMITLVRTMKQRYPKAEVLGHRDFPNVAKECPSFDVKKWLEDAQV